MSVIRNKAVIVEAQVKCATSRFLSAKECKHFPPFNTPARDETRHCIFLYLTEPRIMTRSPDPVKSETVRLLYNIVKLPSGIYVVLTCIRLDTMCHQVLRTHNVLNR